MRFRVASLISLSLMVCLAGSHTSAAEKAAAEKAAKPALVVRVSSVNTLISDAKYLAQMAGQEEMAKQIDGFVQKFTGEKGIEGLDTTKPVGMYGRLTADITSSEGVLLVPVSKPKELLAYLAEKGIKPDEQEGGLYKLEMDGVPVPIFFRFANGYVYITAANADALDKTKLLAPALVFAATPAATLSITVHLDEIPAGLKKEFLAQTELKIEEAKKEEGKPGETKAEAALRIAAIDETFALMKAITNEGGPVSLVFDIDRKNEQLVLSARLGGVPNSQLAASINRLSQVKSLAPALLAPDSALYFGGSLSLSDGLRKALPAVFDAEFKKEQENETDKEKKELTAQFYRAMSPTWKAGEFDAAVDFRGPSATGKYTIVAGVKVQDGVNLEKTLKAMAKKAAADDKVKITLDFAKVGTTSIHKIDGGDTETDPEFKKLVGGSVGYVAVRDDALFMTIGENALPAIKAALAVEPKPGPVMRMELQMARFVPFLAKEQKSAPSIAKEVFKTKGTDRISIVLEGGKEINLRATMKVQLLAFFFKMNEKKDKDL